MVKVYEMKTVIKDEHHMFTYENDKKTPIPDDGVVFIYLDDNGLMHATDNPDIAGSVTGKFIVTNEVKAEKGFPVVYGTVYKIHGAGETYVNLSHDSNEKFHTKPEFENGAKKITVPQNTYRKMRDCEILREIYMMLK